jgi:hypothetical protein
MRFGERQKQLRSQIGIATVASVTQRLQREDPTMPEEIIPILSGAHTIQNAMPPISGFPPRPRPVRFLDAPDTPDKDFAVVTRPAQDNLTQRWIFRHAGGRLYTIQQQHTGRFLDAHDSSDKNFAVVTRPEQDNTTQRWIVAHISGDTYTLRQQSTGRFLEAIFRDDAPVVTRPRSGDSIQRWIIRPVGAGTASG